MVSVDFGGRATIGAHALWLIGLAWRSVSASRDLWLSSPAPYFADGDILLLSSQWEGFPAVPLEAMAAGCDVVATDCSPGLTDLLANCGRETVPIEDPAALAIAIEEAIDRADGVTGLREPAAQYSIAASARDHLRIVAPYLD